MPDYLPTLAEAPTASAIPGVEERKRRERIAAALLMQGSSGEPIQSWTQGLNRVAQGLIGGYQLGESRRQGEAERQLALAEDARIGEAIRQSIRGQGAGMPSAAVPDRTAEIEPPAPAAATPAPTPQRVASAGSPDAYINQEFATAKGALDTGVFDPQGSAFPKTMAALPPSPGMSPAGAVPVQTQSIRPPAAPAAAPAPAAMPPRFAQQLQLAEALAVSRDPRYRQAGLQLAVKTQEQMQAWQEKQQPVLKEFDPDKPPMLYDPRSQSMKPVPVAGGTAGEPTQIVGPDGTVHTVPAGQSTKKFRETLTTITAEAVGGKKTEAQSKASRFADRMENAEPGVQQVEKEGLDFWQKRAGELPLDIGRYAQTEGRLRYDTFKGQWISGFLRADSGAVINPSEYRDADNQFFPQPGDTPKILQDKREARRVATEAMKKEAGPGYKPPTAAPTAPTTPQGDPIAQARAAIAAGAPKAKVIERLRQNGIAPPADL